MHSLHAIMRAPLQALHPPLRKPNEPCSTTPDPCPSEAHAPPPHSTQHTRHAHAVSSTAHAMPPLHPRHVGFGCSRVSMASSLGRVQATHRHALIAVHMHSAHTSPLLGKNVEKASHRAHRDEGKQVRVGIDAPCHPCPLSPYPSHPQLHQLEHVHAIHPCASCDPRLSKVTLSSHHSRIAGATGSTVDY